MQINNLEDLLKVQLQALFSIENQLVQAIPVMADNATEEKLKVALRQHLEVTRVQAQRLQEIGQMIGLNLSANNIQDMGMNNIIKEGETMLWQITDPIAKDAAVIGGADKIEHYEIAAYESAVNLAKKLQLDDVAEKLGNTYKEEKKTAESIKMMADGGIMGKIGQAFS